LPDTPGIKNFKIYNSLDNSLLLEINNFEVIPGQILTYALYGSLDNIQVLPIIDDINEIVARDESIVRIYNLDSYTIGFTINKDTELETVSLSANLSPGEGTDYMSAISGNYNLEIRTPNQPIIPKAITITLNPGRIYTIYIIGSVSPDDPDYDFANIPQVVLVVDGNTIFNQCIWI